MRSPGENRTDRVLPNPNISRVTDSFRDRTLDTRLGTLQLRIPKLRAGPSYFPPFLEPRKTSEKALVAVIQEA